MDLEFVFPFVDEALGENLATCWLPLTPESWYPADTNVQVWSVNKGEWNQQQ